MLGLDYSLASKAVDFFNKANGVKQIKWTGINIKSIRDYTSAIYNAVEASYYQLFEE